MEPINVNESVWKDKQGLKKEIAKVENYEPKSLLKDPVEMYRDAGELWRETHEMSESLSLLGEFQMRKYSPVVSAQARERVQQQSVLMSEKAQKIEEQKEKQSKREKAATKRLGVNHKYFNQSEDSLKAALQRNKALENAGEIQGSLRSLTGDEFATNPETGEMMLSIDELLKRRSELKKYIGDMEATQQEALRSNANKRDALEVNREIFQNLNEVIRLYYLANGVDGETGKSVGFIRKGSARKEFALAMETYRDSMKNASDTYVNKQFTRMVNERKQAFYEAYSNFASVRKTSGERVADSKKTEEIRHTLTEKEQQERLFTNKFPLSATYQEDVVAIRDMIRNSENQYHENKEVIDRMYHDWLDSAMTVSQLGDMEKVNATLIGTQAINSKLSNRLNRKKEIVQTRMQAQMSGIIYLLKGNSDMELVDAIFLKQKYGLETVIYQNVATKVEELKGKTAQQIADMRFYAEKVDQEYASEMALEQEIERRTSEITDAGGNPNEDAELVLKMRTLKRLRANNCDMTTVTGFLWHQKLRNSPEELEIYEKKQELYLNTFMTSYEKNPTVYYTEKNAMGKEIHKSKYSTSATQRDVFSNVSSLLHPGDCGVEKGLHFLDNITVLQNLPKSHMNKEYRERAEIEIQKLIDEQKIPLEQKEEKVEARRMEIFKEAYRKAFTEELEMQRAAKEEIEAYIKSIDMDAKATQTLSMEELMDITVKARPIFEKTQGLYARIKSIWTKPDFGTMPKEEQVELLQIMGYMASAMSCTKGFQESFANRAKGEAVKPIKSREELMENYMAECSAYLNSLQQEGNS